MTTWFGGASAAAGSTSYGGNYIHGHLFSAPASGVVNAARGRMGAGGSVATQAMALVYADSAGSPGALLGASGSVAIAGSAAVAMLNFTFSSPPTIVSGTSYWIMLFEGGGSGVSFEYANVAGGKYQSRSFASGPPNPFGVASAGATERAYLECGIDPPAAATGGFLGFM